MNNFTVEHSYLVHTHGLVVTATGLNAFVGHK